MIYKKLTLTRKLRIVSHTPFKFTEKYQKLENEKKNTRTVRKAQTGPIIRYQSLSMPVMVLSEVNCDKEDDKINIDGDDEKNGNASSENKDSDATADDR